MAPTLYDEKKPEPGDLLEIFRGAYQHWAVYIGDGYIVHLAPPPEVPGAGANSIMCVFYETALVKMEELRDVVGTDRWQINNRLDEEYEPCPAHVIVTEARKLVGTKLPYCVYSNNCEHFATERRYGKPESRQVRKAVELVSAGVIGTIFTIGVVALAGSLFEGGNKEKRNTH